MRPGATGKSPGGSLREALGHCVLCGKCKASCPTYALRLDEKHSPRGRLALALALHEGEIEATGGMARALYSCLLCGRCEAVCPAGVDVTGAVAGARRMLASAGRGSALMRMGAAFAAYRPRAALRYAGLAGPVLGLGIPVALAKGAAFTGAGVYGPARGGRPRGRVAMFLGCAARYAMPALAVAAIGSVTGMGYEVALADGPGCCGSPLRTVGLVEEAEALGTGLMRSIAAVGADALMSPCPTCLVTLGRMDPGRVWLPGAMDLGRLAREAGHEPRATGGGLRVAYHEPCHERYGIGPGGGDARALIGAMGYELVGPRENGCCGFGAVMTGGTMARQARDACLGDYEGAEMVVTSCPGCVMHLAGGHPRVEHLMALVSPRGAEARARSKKGAALRGPLLL